eukprot:TRINITY_DN1897_c0_g1_i2.p1 TRINITY_DN1897_c0_g1~~TRINITY_DN1897_c0_g1_i2.p1  ORF type:complete len:139 (+),score=27.39 TRINITY_DN1897_c0_g1_i2:743-1159(+)
MVPVPVPIQVEGPTNTSFAASYAGAGACHEEAVHHHDQDVVGNQLGPFEDSHVNHKAGLIAHHEQVAQLYKELSPRRPAPPIPVGLAPAPPPQVIPMVPDYSCSSSFDSRPSSEDFVSKKEEILARHNPFASTANDFF